MKSVCDITALDILEMTDCPCEICKWLCSDDWPDADIYRLAGEFGDLLFTDGHINPEDYETLRFALSVLPDEVDGQTAFEMMEDAMSGDCCVDEDDYADFLDWLYREESSYLPGECQRTFEYAFATGPYESACIWLDNAGCGAVHEVLVNLARMGYDEDLGDDYFDLVADTGDAETIATVMHILADRAAEAEEIAEALADELDETGELLGAFCDKCGVDPDCVYEYLYSDEEDEETETADGDAGDGAEAEAGDNAEGATGADTEEQAADEGDGDSDGDNATGDGGEEPELHPGCPPPPISAAAEQDNGPAGPM